MAYVYLNDLPIAEVAEKYDSYISANKVYRVFLKDTKPVTLLLYDFNKISLRDKNVFDHVFPKRTTSRQCVLDFLAIFHNLFERSHSFEFSVVPENITMLCGEVINQLFDDYAIEMQKQVGRDFDKVIEYAQMWVAVTSELIQDIFDNQNSSPDAFGKAQYNFDLYKGLMAVIDECYECFVETLRYGKFVSASDIILYNYWGDEYGYLVSKVRRDVCPSVEEEGMLDLYMNKVRFAREVHQLLKDAMKASVSLDGVEQDYHAKFQMLIQNMFSEFTKHLRRKQVVSRESLVFSVDFWGSTTSNIIIREMNNQGIECRLSSYDPEDSVHPSVFRVSREMVSKIKTVDSLRSMCLSFINRICESFKYKLLNGELIYVWAGDLALLNIDYALLYNRMFGVVFNGIDRECFVDSIKCADLSPLEKHLINPQKNKSALVYLVQTIGKHVDSWYVAAARSLTDSSGNSHSKESIQRLTKSTEGSATMSEILKDCIRTPKQSQKRKSKLQ